MKYQAIIFDFNGVILWDRKWHEEAWNELSKQLRNKSLTRFEREHYIHGRTTRETLPFLLGRKPKSHEAKKLLRQKELLYQKIALENKKFELSPGAVTLFNTLKRNRIKQNIATSSPLINVKFYYKHLGLNEWFPQKEIVFDNGHFPGKPEPDIYLKAAKKINTDISRCIVVEDAKSGILSARNARAGKIIGLVAKGNQSILSELRVDKLIKTLDQITLKDFI